ncbi:MAG TPA: glycosyltransferase [Gammaproteobacteria bacterium]|nr:glycosyltransferase [Gammaproteobacteria bacterium]
MLTHHLSYDIVIPVFNEEKRLPIGISSLLDFLKLIKMENFTITIADNGSTDRTRIIAHALTKQHPKVRLISVWKKGVGLALKTAWYQSVADVVGYMDVDLATDITHFQEVINLFETNTIDLVNGSRHLPSSIVKNRSALRILTSLGYNKILYFLLNIHFTDGMCGFKFLRKSVYKKLMDIGIKNDGWFFCTEILYLSEKSGFSIKEIPVKWTDDRDSRVQLIKTILYYLKEILKLRFRNLKGFTNE